MSDDKNFSDSFSLEPDINLHIKSFHFFTLRDTKNHNSNLCPHDLTLARHTEL